MLLIGDIFKFLKTSSPASYATNLTYNYTTFEYRVGINYLRMRHIIITSCGRKQGYVFIDTCYVKSEKMLVFSYCSMVNIQKWISLMIIMNHLTRLSTEIVWKTIMSLYTMQIVQVRPPTFLTILITGFLIEKFCNSTHYRNAIRFKYFLEKFSWCVQLIMFSYFITDTDGSNTSLSEKKKAGPPENTTIYTVSSLYLPNIFIHVSRLIISRSLQV